MMTLSLRSFLSSVRRDRVLPQRREFPEALRRGVKRPDRLGPGHGRLCHLDTAHCIFVWRNANGIYGGASK